MRGFFQQTYLHADRLLTLIALDQGGDGDPTEGDHSHINFRPKEWWEQEARNAGWIVGDASQFNQDERSIQMNWHGRFLYFVKEI